MTDRDASDVTVTVESPLARCEKKRASLCLDDRLALRAEELGRVLGCSERFIRDQLHRIPHFYLGGALLFPIDPIRAWLAAEAKVEQREIDRVLDSLRQRIKDAVNSS